MQQVLFWIKLKLVLSVDYQLSLASYFIKNYHVSKSQYNTVILALLLIASIVKNMDHSIFRLYRHHKTRELEVARIFLYPAKVIVLTMLNIHICVYFWMSSNSPQAKIECASSGFVQCTFVLPFPCKSRTANRTLQNKVSS